MNKDFYWIISTDENEKYFAIEKQARGYQNCDLIADKLFQEKGYRIGIQEMKVSDYSLEDVKNYFLQRGYKYYEYSILESYQGKPQKK